DQPDLPRKADTGASRYRYDYLLALVDQTNVCFRHADLDFHWIQFNDREERSSWTRHRPFLNVALRHKTANRSGKGRIAQSLSRDTFCGLGLVERGLCGGLVLVLRTLLCLAILLLSVCVCRLVFLEIVRREALLLIESFHPAKLIFSLQEIRPRLFDDFRSRGHRSLLVLSTSKRTLCDRRLHRRSEEHTSELQSRVDL